MSETAANFTDLEIFYKSNDGHYGSVKVHNPDGKNVSLLSATPQSASNQAYFKQRTVHISGAAISTLGSVGSGLLGSGVCSIVLHILLPLELETQFNLD